MVGNIQPALESMGLVVDHEASSHLQLYATDRCNSPLAHSAHVSVISSWSDQSSGEVLIEVRSNEPLLRPQSRCQALALELRSKLQPLAE